MATMTKRQRIRKIEAAIDTEKIKKTKSAETLQKLRIELKNARRER